MQWNALGFVKKSKTNKGFLKYAWSHFTFLSCANIITIKKYSINKMKYKNKERNNLIKDTNFPNLFN